MPEQLPVANENNKYTNKVYEESAKRNNIDINDETVKSVREYTEKRGIEASYNADMFENNSEEAVWRITKDADGNVVKREVFINPKTDSKKTLQNIVTHEMYHDFAGTELGEQLKKLVLDYNEKIDVDPEIKQQARQNLEEIYSKVYDKNSAEFKSLVDEETVASILGNKLETKICTDLVTSIQQ